MIAVVGGGPAGLSCAHALVKRGLEVELYEMDKLGGTCLNYGCRYVNALKEVSDIIDNLNAITGKKHGLNDVISLNELHEKIYKIHKSMRESAKKTLDERGIFVKFEEFKEEYEKNYDYVVYATGQNYDKTYLEVDCAIHSELPYLKKLPKKILIIGGGTVAAEYASIFSTFGSEVTVITSYSIHYTKLYDLATPSFQALKLLRIQNHHLRILNFRNQKLKFRILKNRGSYLSPKNQFKIYLSFYI